MRKAYSFRAAKGAIAASLLACLTLHALVLPGSARAQSLIRDAEIEHTIRTYAAPLLRAAGMAPEDVKLHILKERDLNAFVSRGQQIFLSTGLLARAEHPGQVMGVIAHEIGHITGGHLARLEGALSDAQDQALIGSILGMAVGVLAGQPGAAAAASAKAQDVALRNLLSFTRVQERSADQVGINLLNQSQISARGLLEFFEVLQDQELLSRERQDPYAVTHPLTRDRIAFVAEQVDKSPYSNAEIPTALRAEHDRMVAKLHGFIDPPSRTLHDYKADDPSVKARYARAIAYYQDAQLDKALPLIDGLIREAPGDPWFQELKGQMLFENARVADALPYYEASVRLRPDEPLLRVGLAHAQIEMNRPELMKSALDNLEQGLREDKHMPLAWRLAAVAYGRDGQLGQSALSLAEYNMLIGQPFDAMGQANKAMRLLKEGSPAWLRAQDLHVTAERLHKKRQKN